eukprot:7958586-Pyramimonas_sp.AAC.2
MRGAEAVFLHPTLPYNSGLLGHKPPRYPLKRLHGAAGVGVSVRMCSHGAAGVGVCAHVRAWGCRGVGVSVRMCGHGGVEMGVCAF